MSVLRIHYFISSASPDVNVITLITRESSGFYSVQSTLQYKVEKEDEDARFSCGASFFVPGAIKTLESHNVNITVHCELTPESATV